MSQETVELVRRCLRALENDTDAFREWAMQIVGFARALPPKEKK